MSVIEAYQFDIFADYHQFWLADEDALPSPSNSEAGLPPWTDQTVADMLAVKPAWLAIGTVRNMTVPVTVEIHDAAPEDSFGPWDHITDASLSVPSGRLIVGFHADEMHHLAVEPGEYRVRVFYGELDSVDEMGIEGNDQYRVALWPGSAITPMVLKRWKTKRHATLLLIIP